MLSLGLMSGTSMDGIDAALLETNGNEHVKALGPYFLSYPSQFKILLKSAEYAVKYSGGHLENAKRYYPDAIKAYLKQELTISDVNLAPKIATLSTYLSKISNSALHKNRDPAISNSALHKNRDPAISDSALHKNRDPANRSNNLTNLSLDNVIHHLNQMHAFVVKKLIKSLGYLDKDVDVVGYHGQTLGHFPARGITIQVGEGQDLADLLNIPVISEFRRRDVQAGGQGAPFAPLYHLALAVRDQKIPVAVVNCGGIANLTLISSSNEAELIAFDTGPGNALIDRLIRQHTQGKENMDRNGHYGQQGKVNKKILDALYEKSAIIQGKNYFQIKPPKSLDYGDIDLIPELTSKAFSLPDACKTLATFTADSIVNSLHLVDMSPPSQWILAGGGWQNPVIRQELCQRLNQKYKFINIQTAEEAGWNSHALEAEVFAYLAVRSLQNRPLSMPNTTGVPTPLSGGVISIPNIVVK